MVDANLKAKQHTPLQQTAVRLLKQTMQASGRCALCKAPLRLDLDVAPGSGLEYFA